MVTPQTLPTPPRAHLTRFVVLVALALLAWACSPAPETPAGPDAASQGGPTPRVVEDDSRFPDILDVELTDRGDSTWRAAVTVSSPYDSPERYADAWRVLGPDGTELVVRVLTHHHADEQPFTRTSEAFMIPDGVVEVTVEGRDLVNGWGGGTVTVPVPGRD